MITFMALLITLIALAIISTLIVLAGGAGIILAFGDVIVCVMIVGLIIRLFTRRR